MSLLALGACTCAQKPAAAPDAGVALPAGVTPGVQALRDADVALSAGRLDEAIAKATEALRLEPAHPVASNVLGRALMQRFQRGHDPRDAEAAKAAFESAARAKPAFWPALQNLGALAELQGHAGEAAAWYQRVLDAEPAHPERERFQRLVWAADGGAP